MSLDENQFHEIANEFLDQLFDQLDDQIGDRADVDMEDGILNVELDAGGTYIINKHAPNKQIWLASPKSGASHYEYKEDRWIGTRDGADLQERLAEELNVTLS